ncbi:hypothetical protein H5162_11630 [Pseudoalteromonas sp. SR41-8]|uniref:hypothetical protein n=1 Tax=Pseudoalteromonas sp. SR41-8 TaxID=2760946 RepID=UPI0016049258|nr:hypothetical protein [Pseudoalteromonas sp. SR41-8]MBB1310072.1 hypothetical protein [Pseudoalteromonas sp. SR41-8]
MIKVFSILLLMTFSIFANASDKADLTGLGLACPDAERSKKFFPVLLQLVVEGNSEKLDMSATVLKENYGCHLMNNMTNKMSMKVNIHKKVKDGEYDFYQFSIYEINGKRFEEQKKYWIWDFKLEGFPLFNIK